MAQPPDDGAHLQVGRFGRVVPVHSAAAARGHRRREAQPGEGVPDVIGAEDQGATFDILRICGDVLVTIVRLLTAPGLSMIRSHFITVGLLIAAIAAGPATTQSAKPSTTQSTTPATTQSAKPATTQAVNEQEELQDWWDDLNKTEPWCSRALLDFSSRPDLAVAFFKANLKPLKLDKKEMDAALADLGNDDEKVWKPAFEKLQYLDPRLAEDVEKLMDDVVEPIARARLAAVLTGVNADRFKGLSITLQKFGGNTLYLRADRQGYFMLEPKVSRISKAEWTRASRAMVLLQHIGTPQALAVLKEMATGNPAAEPTQVARAAVESLTSESHPKK